MAATDTVGQVQTIYLQTVDNIGTQYETNINGRNMTVNPNATYQQVNAALRALNALTTNTYVDTQLITAISVSEEMDSGAPSDSIGRVQTLYLQTEDNLGTQYETNINGRNMTVNPNTDYYEVFSAMRKLTELTTNTYVDTQLITAISVNEEIAEE